MITLRERPTGLEATWDYRTGWTGDKDLAHSLELLGWGSWHAGDTADAVQARIAERAAEPENLFFRDVEVITQTPSGEPPRPAWTGPGPTPCDW